MVRCAKELPLFADGRVAGDARGTVSSGAIEPGEFDGLMARLGPFGAARRVVVGVSGGVDSLALAWLLRHWGQPLAVVVDHGLRPESAYEAAVTIGRLAAMGVRARVERLAGLSRGPNLGARARAARYAALLRVCRIEGLPDLVIAHHAQDQAETVLLRQAAGSGAAGLAAMPSIGFRADARILRPLLSVTPDRLRATLVRAGVDWVDDPSNQDRNTARGALRSAGVDVRRHFETACRAGVARRAGEMRQSDELGRVVAMYGSGHGVLSGPIASEGWSALIWTISGRDYPPGSDGVWRLCAMATGTLHGVRVRGGVVMREAVQKTEQVSAVAGAMWDARFLVRRTVPDGLVIAWGDGASGLRGRGAVLFSIRRALPVLRLGTDLFTNPDLVYVGGVTCTRFQVEFRPARPLAGAPFVPAI